MKFVYKAYDKTGQNVSDIIEAPELTDAFEQLRRKGLFVTEVKPADEHAVIKTRRRRRVGGGRRLKNLAMFSRQLQVLVSTGTPIVQALMALERQAQEPNWHAVVAGLRAKVEEGAPLSQAMGQFPEYFDNVSRSLIAAGESSG